MIFNNCYKILIKKILKPVAIFFIITCLSHGFIFNLNKAVAYNQSTLSWRILTTKHFNIYYHNDDNIFAAAVSKIAENSFKDISEKLKCPALKVKIPLILHDFTDSAYGYTNVLQNKVWISITPPDAFELADRVWVESLIRHELTHYLMGTKLDKNVKYGTGRILGWGILPMWFIEGVAQREESSWNEVKDSAVRTAVLSNKLFDLNKLQIFYYFNYYGRRLGYHIGNSIVDFMADKFGESCIPEIIDQAPYKINGFNIAVKKVTGRSMSEIFKMWQEEMRAKYSEQIKNRISLAGYVKTGSTNENYIVNDIGININPRFDCSGGCFYYLSNDARDSKRLSLIRQDKSGSGRRCLLENIEDNFFLDKTCGYIYFARKTLDLYDNLKSDIFKYNLKSGEVKRVSKWLRAQNPVLDYSDNNIFVVIYESGTTNICKIDKDGKIVERITQIGYDSSIYDIQMARNNESDAAMPKILFMNYFKNGRHDIAFVNYDKTSPDYGKIIPVTGFDGMILKPKVFYEGGNNYTAYFIKAVDSIFNICSIKFEIDSRHIKIKDFSPVTNFKESVLDFDYDFKNKKIAVITLASGGTDIAILDASKNIYGPGYDERKKECVKKYSVVNCNNEIEIKTSLSEKRTSEVNVIKNGDYHIMPYKTVPKLEYVIPMLGSQSSKTLYGVTGRVSDPISRHVFDFQTLYGGKYHNLAGTYTYKGFRPTVGVSVYDITRDLRPGVLENFKGIDLFANYKLWNNSLTISLFDRDISSNSISPLLALRDVKLLTGEKKDRGYSFKFTQYSAENTVDSEIHPINAHLINIFHQNSTARLNSFYNYRINRYDISKWMILSEKIKNTVKLRVYGGEAFGDYDFQVGGYRDLRGYSTLNLVGKKVMAYSMEYSHMAINEPLKLRVFSINKVYPDLFFDSAAVYNDGISKRWHSSAGLEFKMRVLIFKKTPLIGKFGIAKRLSDDKATETYTAFELKY
ncbi:MAG: hypothetical protein QMC67_05270 [Candidatus Wallbacteria bacterium]